ncbi:unnamed protein product [Paramecium primaurelia]|uniref:Uncharacterized protein n=1 Tax=Paramecium primaurelia TaxID=5886 RepID=A0A8S1JWU1_PARPR|nr:unnamed protein product [Paramecium primaurelia]
MKSIIETAIKYTLVTGIVNEQLENQICRIFIKLQKKSSSYTAYQDGIKTCLILKQQGSQSLLLRSRCKMQKQNMQ